MQFWSCLPQHAKQLNVLSLPQFINKAEIRGNKPQALRGRAMRYFILLCYFLVACSEVLIADKITADELHKRRTASKYTFSFLNTIFKSILLISRTQFSRRIRDIVQLQRFLCQVTKK